MPAESLVPDEEPVRAEPPPVGAFRKPIQSLEERGDAMLFESEALYGTPFTQAAVMPFDQTAGP